MKRIIAVSAVTGFYFVEFELMLEEMNKLSGKFSEFTCCARRNE